MNAEDRIRQAMAKPIWLRQQREGLKDTFPMPGPYPSMLRFLVLTYQVGHPATCLFRSVMLGNADDEAAKSYRAYMADAKLHIADGITQYKVLCLELGFDIEEVEELGLAHLEETAAELKTGAREA